MAGSTKILQKTHPTQLLPQCAHVCGGISGKSCAKMCLVHVYPQGRRQERRKMYVILDDQSNVSLARTAFFDVSRFKGQQSHMC